MNEQEILKVLCNGSPAEVEAIIKNRKAVNQEQLKALIKPLRAEGIYVDIDNMSESTWYYIWKKVNVKGPHEWERVNLANQFYWNKGTYNKEGVHSLFDEYGELLKK